MSNTVTTETKGGAGRSGSGSGGEYDIFKPTLKLVDELYDTDDNFFSPTPHEKLSKMKELISSALQLLDSIPVEKRNLPMQRATYEYLRGKILEFSPSYKKEAEDHLAKAVKMNPSRGDAWLSLGKCIWKRGEAMAGRNCMILALSKAPSKRILCQLSILERNMAQVNVSKLGKVLLKESIKHARQALAMDVKDGYSWNCLGDALLNSFFETGEWDLNELQDSLKAYQNAERDAKMKYNPNLSFNGAAVNRYLENYEKALSGFEAAAPKDPRLNANEEIRKMVEIFDTIGIYLIAQANARQIVILGSSLDDFKLDPLYRRATLDILQEGVNKGFAIVGKVLFLFDNENIVPLYYCLCDSNYQCYILAVYGARADARNLLEEIKEGDQVTILDPCYRHQDFAWKGKRYVFESLRVDLLERVLVNGKALSPKQTARTHDESH